MEQDMNLVLLSYLSQFIEWKSDEKEIKDRLAQQPLFSTTNDGEFLEITNNETPVGWFLREAKETPGIEVVDDNLYEIFVSGSAEKIANLLRSNAEGRLETLEDLMNEAQD